MREQLRHIHGVETSQASFLTSKLEHDAQGKSFPSKSNADGLGRRS
jgi:hypothetical protein